VAHDIGTTPTNLLTATFFGIHFENLKIFAYFYNFTVFLCEIAVLFVNISQY
jgi:hypothetical protein